MSNEQLDLIDPATGEATVEEHTTERDWLATRRSAIGASEAPIILGLSPYKSPLRLFTDKLGITTPTPETEAQAWGTLLEPAMAARYEQETGHRTQDLGRYTLHRSRALPFMVATLDRVIVHADGEPVPAVLELKKRAWVREGQWDDEPPADVLVQVQHQLAVTGWAWAAVGVLLAGREFRRFRVARHEPFIVKLRQAEEAFMGRLRTRTEPPADAHPSTAEALRALYPVESPGLVVNLPGMAAEWDDQLQRAKAAIKVAEADKLEAENKLKAALGEAEVGVLPSGASYSFKASHRAGYTVEPTTVRTLRRKAGPV